MKNNKYHVEFDIEFLKHRYSGKLIALEGIDGSGKTTQADLVCNELKKSGYKVFSTKNPTDGEIGKFIRQILSGKRQFSPVSFQYLFVADRAYQQEEIISHLKKGEIVITDRYFWSSVAYGAVDRGIDFSKDSNAGVLLSSFGILSTYYQFLSPDLTLILDVSSKAALKRLSSSRDGKDIYDKKEKLDKIAKGYEWLVKKFPEEFTIISAEKSVENVTKEIIEKIKNL